MPNIILNLESNSQGQYIYYPGHVLKGTVELKLNSSKKFRGFYIKLYGHAKAKWTKKQGKHSVTYEGKEVYLNSRTYFFGDHEGHSIEVRSGLHTYKFMCPLPDGLPYSLDINHGVIKYYLEAVLDIPWGFDVKENKPFTIIRYDDLNLIPILRSPQRFEEVKTFFSLFNESKPLQMTVLIPYTGFAIGQDIPLTINYVNKSNVAIIGTKLILKQVIAFTSQTPDIKTKVKEYDMATFCAAGVPAGNSKQLEVRLKIPKVMNSNGNFCSVITIKYIVKIIGETEGIHFNPAINVPITIGSAAIRFQDPQNYPPVLPSAPTEAIDTQMNNDLPPSYAETVMMGTSSYIPES